MTSGHILSLALYVESKSTNDVTVLYDSLSCVLLCFFQPKVVTDTDETELARQLERLERENAEVDGDDDAEEMEAKTED